MRINLFYIVVGILALTSSGLGANMLLSSHDGDSSVAPIATEFVPNEDVILGTSSSLEISPISIATTSVEQLKVETPAQAPQVVATKKVALQSPVIKSGDTTSPTQPLSLIATTTDTRASISWLSSKDNIAVVGYKVFRNGVEVGTTPFLKYSQINLLPETFYTFEVSAYDKAGNVSLKSSAVKVKTLAKITSTAALPTDQTLPLTPVDPIPDTNAPTIPGNVTADVLSTSAIGLAWTPSTDAVGVLGYSVFRNGALVTNITDTTFTDAALSPDTSYAYTVSAYDAAGNTSDRSSSIIGTTLATPLPIPDPTPVTNPTPTPTPTPTPSPTPTPAGTPTTYTVNVTSSGVISPSSVTLVAGDSITWVYVAPINDEVILRFTPTLPTSIKLDHDTTTRTYTFTAAGTWSYRAGGAYATIIVQ